MQPDQVMKRRILSRLLGTTAMIVVSACTDSGSGGLDSTPSEQQATTAGKLRAAYIAAVQHDAPESYWARESAGAVMMDNLAQRFVAKVERGVLSVTSSEHPWRFAMRGTAVGCDGAMELMTESAAEIASHGVQLQRAEIEESYLNGPLGVEQSFVMAKAPPCTGHKRITLAIEGNLSAVLDDANGDGRGDAVKFVDEEGRAALQYADLFVTDAQGRSVPAWLSVKAGEVAIVVDDARAEYPLTIDPLLWVEQAKLKGNDVGSTDYFGSSVAIDGNTALVGSVNDTTLIGNYIQGSVYVFTNTGGVWTQVQKLTPNEAPADDGFGTSVAIDGDTALIGAAWNDIGANPDQGSTYVFARNGGMWTQQQKLTASDGAATDLFGIAVALSGDVAVVGAPLAEIGANENQGSAYVFTRSGGVWTEQQKLTGSNGLSQDNFGTSVSLSVDTALIGAPGIYDSEGGPETPGAAYVFTGNGGLWTEQQKLVPSDSEAGNTFGSAVALSGDKALVGAPDDTVGSNARQGSAYVFMRSGGVWTEQQKLTASDAVAQDYSFGDSVALVGDTALVGMRGDSFIFPGGYYWFEGAAYVFINNGGVWTEQQKLTASDINSWRFFGCAVAMSGNRAIVGSYGHDDEVVHEKGSAYVFQVAGNANGAFCAQGSACASGFCVDGVCCDTACGQGNANDCQACSIAAGAAVDGKCAMVAVGTICRSAAGTCDAQEACDGVSSACPADTKLPQGTNCRASAGACDIAETCDGLANTCPADTKVAAGTECRPRAGICDIAETCDGATDVCPADAKVATGIACRASTGACDIAETCDGVANTCPSDAKVAAGTECRASAGACDVAESCDGAANTCPADAKVAAGSECRASAAACDLAESCNGSADACPADVNAPDGTICPSGTCKSGACMGSGGAGSSSGAGGVGGSGSSGGAAGAGGAVEVGGGAPVTKGDDKPLEFCGWDCRVSPVKPTSNTRSGLVLFGLALLALRRRRTR